MRRPPLSPLSFLLLVLLTSFSLSLPSCEQKDLLLIDTAGNAPQILSTSLDPAFVNSDTINVGSDRKATDLISYNLRISARIIHPLQQSQIAETAFIFFRTRREPEIAQGFLKDDGVFPDSAANDSTFTGGLQFTALRSEIGRFYAEINSADAQGYMSNSIRIPFTIQRLNQQPVLSDLAAPDTVYPGFENAFLITVRATDPDGQSDILSVSRTTPSNLVLFLNDDGVNGDTAAGDSIYTETVSLSPPPPFGTYVFTFKAVDRSNAASPLITKTIVVAP